MFEHQQINHRNNRDIGQQGAKVGDFISGWMVATTALGNAGWGAGGGAPRGTNPNSMFSSPKQQWKFGVVACVPVYSSSDK
jgi:hypothetical protein